VYDVGAGPALAYDADEAVAAALDALSSWPPEK